MEEKPKRSGNYLHAIFKTILLPTKSNKQFYLNSKFGKLISDHWNDFSTQYVVCHKFWNKIPFLFCFSSYIPIICSNLLDRIETFKKLESIIIPKLFWTFTVGMNCSSDLKNSANSQPSASNFKSFSQSLNRTILVTDYYYFFISNKL